MDNINYYRVCGDIVVDICNRMPDALYEYTTKIDNSKRSIYYHILDAYNSIADIINMALRLHIAQACILLRNLVECVATINVLLNNPNCLNIYNSARQLKLETEDLDKELRNKRVEEFCKSNGYNPIHKNRFDVYKGYKYVDYGWMSELDSDFGVEKLIELADLKDYTIWRNFFSRFTHLSFTTLDIESNKFNLVTNQLIYITCSLFNELCSAMHQANGFNFNFNDLRYQDYLEIIKTLKFPE